MKRVLFLVLPILLFGENLKSLLDYANQNSKIVASSRLSKDAKIKEVDSNRGAYMPTLDIGGTYQNIDKKSAFQAGDTYNGFAKVGFDIYDGGRRSAILNRSKDELKASQYSLQDTKQSLNFQIVQDFFSIKTLQATLKSKEDVKKSLEEQLSRVKQFYEAKLAVKDDVERLQASYDTNIYEIESIRFKILSVKKYLELKVSKNIDSLDDSGFKEVGDVVYEQRDSIKSLISGQKAIISGSESIDSVYYPKVRVEDSYNIYDYNDVDPIATGMLADKQNVLSLSVSMRLFDYGSARETKQATILSAKALEQEINYKNEEQKISQELAREKIKTTKLQIASAASALKSASSAYEIIKQKFDARIVDNVVFLDALSAKTAADALHESAKNDLEVAYATYYYYSGKDLGEFIK
ncbi:TolC family protein [Sulfurimonas sp.]|uniref:TolC family protein n=1 Tax=Sulfurimonas sp. TaxID=2022749 RepID=UPI0025D163E6|nr:TolC family protein [Sulfurimonas sp.]MDD5157625.1 TolC family protein [Sulfurimonas sp.]